MELDYFYWIIWVLNVLIPSRGGKVVCEVPCSVSCKFTIICGNAIFIQNLGML